MPAGQRDSQRKEQQRGTWPQQRGNQQRCSGTAGESENGGQPSTNSVIALPGQCHIAGDITTFDRVEPQRPALGVTGPAVQLDDCAANAARGVHHSAQHVLGDAERVERSGMPKVGGEPTEESLALLGIAHPNRHDRAPLEWVKEQLIGLDRHGRRRKCRGCVRANGRESIGLDELGVVPLILGGMVDGLTREADHFLARAAIHG